MLAKGFSTPALQHPALPESAAWFPLPPGWYVLGSLLLLAIAISAIGRLARYRRNRWRREARRQLAEQTVDSWMTLIKRVLLVHHPRSKVSQWQTPGQLLAQTPLDEELRAALSLRYCQPENQLDRALQQRVAGQLGRWLESLPDV
ncbi:DUF4381 family protein [Pantoea sp. FN060301]|uniref:DUF4381 family protein n=1 Tax=Pantoea sp. FN060301 TaxID=3420380 RepID=UPI003D16A497